jgi:sulfate permease, SulP family
MRLRSDLADQLLPFLHWWRNVNAQTLRADAVAGLIGAIIVIPQGVAFATLAGMPPEYGLYLSMIPAVVAALWGSSWHAVSGPTTSLSLLVFATLAPLASPGSAEYIRLALTLSLMSGLMMLALGVARMGGLVNFISNTVVIGFMAGAGLLIAESQLRNFFGLDLPREESFFRAVWTLAQHVADSKPLVVTVSLFTLAVALASRRWLRQLPYMIVALVAGSVLAFILNTLLGPERTGLAVIGKVPSPLPPLSVPSLSFDTLRGLAGAAVSITLLSIAQAIPIARAIGTRSGQRIDANQELIGQGLSNVAASFFSGYPSSASLNRTGANFEAGARTPLAAVLSVPFLIALLFAIAPLIAFIPAAVVAAILVLVGWALIDFGAIRKVACMSRPETFVLAVTFLATMTLSLDVAVLAGVFVSLVAYLYRTSRPTMRSLVPDPHDPERKMVEVAEALPECPQLKILRIEGSIYFGATNHVATHFDTLRKVNPAQKHLLIMAKSMNFVDVAGADLLAEEAATRRAQGGDVYLYSLRQPAREMLHRGGQLDGIGHRNIFVSKDEAIAKVFARLDRGVCRQCTARIFLECRTVPGFGDAGEVQQQLNATAGNGQAGTESCSARSH